MALTVDEPVTAETVVEPPPKPGPKEVVQTAQVQRQVPAAPVTPIEAMVQNQNIPGELILQAQKEFGKAFSHSAQIRALEKHNRDILDKVFENEADGIRVKGEAAVNPRLDANAMMQAGYTQAEVAVILDRREAYKRTNSATAHWNENTPYAQMKQDLERLHPLNVAPNSPAFSTHVKEYEEAEKRALKFETERERAFKAKAVETDQLAEQMKLPDGLRPNGVAKINDAWLAANAKHMSGEAVHKAGKYLRGGAEYTDQRTRDDLIQKGLYMSQEEFREEVFNARVNNLITNADEDHMFKWNADAQTDVGVKYLKEAMDTKLLGNNAYMQASLNSLREKVIQQYRAEKSAHPEWKDDDRLRYAFELERANAIFDASNVVLSLSVTPFMQKAGVIDRNTATPEQVAAARALATQAAAAGLLNNSQQVVEFNNLKTWEDYFASKAKNAATQKAIEERTRRK